MVPRCLVHDCVTEEVIRAIADRQNRARSIYKQATNLNVLGRLFDRVANDQQNTIRAEMLRVYDEIGAKTVVDEITEEKFRTRMVSFYGKVLIPEMSHLNTCQDLDDEEKFALKWFGFNPKITIVFDDCSTDLSKLKTCADILEQIFQGRHYLCTTIIALHGESVVSPLMRTNASISFFTDPQMARTWVTRANNGFPKDKREVLTRYADQILVEPPHTKMVYMNDQPFLIEVPSHGSFCAVSSITNEFCLRITKKMPDGLEPWMRKL